MEESKESHSGLMFTNIMMNLPHLFELFNHYAYIQKIYNERPLCKTCISIDLFQHTIKRNTVLHGKGGFKGGIWALGYKYFIGQ